MINRLGRMGTEDCFANRWTPGWPMYIQKYVYILLWQIGQAINLKKQPWRKSQWMK